MIGLAHFLVVGAGLFCLGLYCVLTRRNAIGVLMGIELILNSANVNAIAFSKFGTGNPDGQVLGVRHHAGRRRGGDRARHRVGNLPSFPVDRCAGPDGVEGLRGRWAASEGTLQAETGH